MKLGHFSVLEHANYSLLITGVSRSLTHEFVRHRLFSYSQESQRYVDDSDISFVYPEAIQLEDTLHPAVPQEPNLGDLWTEHVEAAHDLYKLLVEEISTGAPAGMSKTEQRKWARQAARSVLPNATATKIVVTGNARAWRHFLNLRGGEGAEPEIRRLSVLILEALREAAPIFFSDFSVGPGNTLKSTYHEI